MLIICRTTAKEKSRQKADVFLRAYSISAALIIRAAVSFFYLNSNDDPLPCKGMAALGGSCHALINLSTQIDIIPIIKKSHYPPTGYSGYVDELSNQLNTAVISHASICVLQAGAFCILQKI
ncbi:MAG: hypothetical protein ACLSX5_01430 [Lachnospiraceae bacterium]